MRLIITPIFFGSAAVAVWALIYFTVRNDWRKRRYARCLLSINKLEHELFPQWFPSKYTNLRSPEYLRACVDSHLERNRELLERRTVAFQMNASSGGRRARTATRSRTSR